MSESEKEARRIYNLMYDNQYIVDSISENANIENAKKCALICVDEILKASNKLISKDLSDLHHWQQVKNEINKI